MTVVYLELIGQNIQDNPDLFPVGHWDGFGPALPQAFSQGTPGGNNTTWGGIILTTLARFSTSHVYSGYTTNYAGAVQSVLVPFQSFPYVGYTTNYGGKFDLPTDITTGNDLNTYIEYPKTQFVYFKLKGFNPQTQSYENWIVTEDITSRPELYDPGRHPPSVERDVFKAPPSGHALTNIAIVARWIQ